MIKVELDGMYSDDFQFETVEEFTEAAVFFVKHKKSFSVKFEEEDKENETGDK